MSLLRTMYRGESKFQFIKHRNRWYFASLIVIAISLLSIAFRGFNYGVEFRGGSQFQITTSGTQISVSAVNSAFAAAGLPGENSAQRVGSGSTQSIVIVTPSPKDLGTQAKVVGLVANSLNIPQSKINPTTVSSEWGHDITIKALQGLVIFLIVVSIYISVRYQWRMAVAGIIALIHDLIVAAGIYSVVGFQVTPSTVVGLLTILGFSLYDTVVVFDKVAENSRDILSGSRITYSEAANTAVNQTLMRSINTSLIALLPVGGLLFVGAGILGVGTIKDLALILFVGLASGAYSSLFLATPIVTDLTEREPAYQALARRVAAKRASDAKRAAEPEVAAAGTVAAPAPRRMTGPAPAPKPGARPVRRR
jgi:preprotein translocase subunit SecF